MLAKDEAYDVIETSPQALKGWRTYSEITATTVDWNV